MDSPFFWVKRDEYVGLMRKFTANGCGECEEAAAAVNKIAFGKTKGVRDKRCRHNEREYADLQRERKRYKNGIKRMQKSAENGTKKNVKIGRKPNKKKEKTGGKRDKKECKNRQKTAKKGGASS